MRKPINAVAAVLLGGLLVWGLPARQSAAQIDENELSRTGFVAFFGTIFRGLMSTTDENERYTREENRERDRTEAAYDGAIRALERGDASAFKRHSDEIDREAHQTRSPGAARLAKILQAALPTHFVPFFAYRREDGTIAADPDKFIRAQLKRAEGMEADGADGGSGRD